MFWNIFMSSLVLIVAILVIGLVVGKLLGTDDE